MANANKPSGFTPVGYLNGAAWNGQARLYSVAASNTYAIGIGDPVISSGTANADGVPGVVRAGTTGSCTGALRGVCVGVGRYEGLMANPSSLDTTVWPASSATVGYIMVVDDPNVIFQIQEESNGTALAATEVGLNQISLAAVTGTYCSAWLLRSTSGATANTTNTLQLRLLGLARIPNNTFGAYAKWLVSINVHELASDGVTGV